MKNVLPDFPRNRYLQRQFVIYNCMTFYYMMSTSVHGSEASKTQTVAGGSRHSPRLNTIRMVEDHIREHSSEYKRRKLWETLPKGMQYQTFREIIGYLIESGKIALDAGGKVCWIHNPDLMRRFAAREDLRIR